MVTVERLVVTVERLVVTVERLVVTGSRLAVRTSTSENFPSRPTDVPRTYVAYEETSLQRANKVKQTDKAVKDGPKV